jgi:hypothetical protein
VRKVELPGDVGSQLDAPLLGFVLNLGLDRAVAVELNVVTIAGRLSKLPI